MVPHALLVLAVVALPSPAEAQSFNCRYARDADEIAICDDPELSRLDERMSRLFFDVRDSVGGRGQAALDAEQAEWLESRRSCRRNPDCIEDAYRQRIRELRRY
jgi:uncharacterized protein